MKFLKTSLLMTALMAGCATTPKVEQGYDHSASYALNVWRASGMEGEMKDTKVPSSKIGGAFDSGSGRLLGIYSDASMAKLGGLDPSVALGAGLFVALFEPEKPAFRDSFFYWEEYREGESELDARTRALNSLKQPVTDALTSMGNKIESTSIRDGWMWVYFHKENSVCSEVVYDDGSVGAPCYVMIRLPKIKSKPAVGTKILGLNNSLYWHQSPKEITRGVIELGHRDKESSKDVQLFLSEINTYEILTKISEKMPKNYFLYLAPKNNTYGGDGKKIEIPLILEQGKSYGFIVEDKGLAQ